MDGATRASGWLVVCGAMALVSGCPAPNGGPDAGGVDSAVPDAMRTDSGATVDAPGHCELHGDEDGDGVRSIACGGLDCDDADAERAPGRTEVCDATGHDEDCEPTTFGDRDADLDGHLDAACCNGTGASAVCGDDCDDTLASAYRGLLETCDGVDNDCDTRTDEGVLRTFFADADGDGYGERNAEGMTACTPPAGTVEAATDCDDTRADAHPGAIELCNGLDDDCFGSGTGMEPGEDADGDGHAWTAAPCTLGALPRDDCNDGLSFVYPGAPELCDAIDDDCSTGGGADVREDLDGDGHAATDAVCSGGALPHDDCDDDVRRVHPGTTDVCDGVDEDCSGTIDDEPMASVACGSGSYCIAAACEMPAVELSRGFAVSCARLGGGSVVCWGNDEFGSLGRGTTGADSPRPVRAVGLTNVTDLAVGLLHACATRATGEVVCWGYGGYGQLGNGLVADRATPTPIISSRPSPIGLGIGAFHSCALYAGTSNQLVCWGANQAGQLGDGTTTNRSLPTNVAGLPAVELAEVVAGAGHTCVRTSAGQVYCWGDNSRGMLGDGGTTPRMSPTSVPVTGVVTDLCAGATHTCAISGGNAFCWGQISIGALNPNTPNMVTGVSGAVELSCGDENACARLASGAVVCWGRNTNGGLGVGDRVDRTSATAVVGLSDATALASGFGGHGCAIRSGGRVSCWGWNSEGQLGDGTFDDRLVPTPVLDLP